jgi:hypothetical protein
MSEGDIGRQDAGCCRAYSLALHVVLSHQSEGVIAAFKRSCDLSTDL